MTAIDRRRVLSGAAVAALGCTLIPSVTQSAPLTIGKGLAGNAEGLVEKTQWGPPPRHPHLNQRWGRRRWRCWWHRGRRVCGWR